MHSLQTYKRHLLHVWEPCRRLILPGASLMSTTCVSNLGLETLLLDCIMDHGRIDNLVNYLFIYLKSQWYTVTPKRTNIMKHSTLTTNTDLILKQQFLPFQKFQLLLWAEFYTTHYSTRIDLRSHLHTSQVSHFLSMCMIQQRFQGQNDKLMSGLRCSLCKLIMRM